MVRLSVLCFWPLFSREKAIKARKMKVYVLIILFTCGNIYLCLFSHKTEPCLHAVFQLFSKFNLIYLSFTSIFYLLSYTAEFQDIQQSEVVKKTKMPAYFLEQILGKLLTFFYILFLFLSFTLFLLVPFSARILFRYCYFN